MVGLVAGCGRLDALQEAEPTPTFVEPDVGVLPSPFAARDLVDLIGRHGHQAVPDDALFSALARGGGGVSRRVLGAVVVLHDELQSATRQSSGPGMR